MIHWSGESSFQMLGASRLLAHSGHALLCALAESPSSSYRLNDCDILDTSVDFTDAPNQNLVVRSDDATPFTNLRRKSASVCPSISKIERVLAHPRFASTPPTGDNPTDKSRVCGDNGSHMALSPFRSVILKFLRDVAIKLYSQLPEHQ